MNVQRSAILPYSATQVYALINDVQKYPEFLNWCRCVTVHEQTDEKQVAEINVVYGKLKLSFTTENALTQDELISMRLVSGPFRELSGQWQLQSLGEAGCKVSLQMGFVFDNPITHKLFGRIFQSVVSTQMDAFQQRAHQIYGA